MTDRHARLAARLLATFADELEELVRTMNADLLALEQTPRDAPRLKSLFRVAHTLKGAAHAAGVPAVEQACHKLEELLAEARDGRNILGAGEFALLFQAADALAEAAALLKAGHDLTGSAAAGLAARLGGGPASGSSPVPADAAPLARAEPGTLVRVDATRLDQLTAAGGQLLVVGSRIVQRADDVVALHELALHGSAPYRRASRTLRLACERAGAGTLAAEALRFIDAHVQQLAHQTSRTSAALTTDARLLAAAVHNVTRDVHGLRMRPIADACEPLSRTVRDVATSGGKEARLETRGTDVEADRAVVDALREALLQLVRNAVDHGIEPTEVRERAGKPRAGTVVVEAALRGDRVVITVSDDGAGLDTDAIRRSAERRGLARPADDAALADLLFGGGVSTLARATTVSGRGVGLDLVRAAALRVRGTVRVASRPGRGTTFTIECPLTLVTLRAVLVAVGPHQFAIPTDQVSRLRRVSPDEVRQVEGRTVLPGESGPIPLVSMARLLGPPLAERARAGPFPVVVLGTGARSAAVTVDELIGEQEIVLRPAGRYEPAASRFVSGATLLGTGRVAPVLDASALVAAALEPGAAAGLLPPPTAGQAPRARILVVDDSITTRTLEQSILEAAGYEVRTAVDGASGWRILQEHGSDLVLADVEMPGMDGFALCRAVRESKRFRELPLILVTALETPEDRARGLEAGADAYIGKSSFDQQNLLDTIHQLLH